MKEVIAGKLFIEGKSISKSFYGNRVLSDVDITLHYGEIVGLVGQNGAGKSTLVKILTGVYQKDGGVITIDGRETEIESVNHASRLGISMVFQELSLVPNLTVAENIFIGKYPRNALGLVKKDALVSQASELLSRFKVDIRPDEFVKDLSPGNRQIVEILKAISNNPKLLILDEPTSSLGESEVKSLFEFIQEVKKDGLAIIYISHYLSEVFDLVDKIMVVRDGVKVGEFDVNELDTEKLISLMIGHEYKKASAKKRDFDQSAATTLHVQHLTGSTFSDVSLSINAGEVLGIAGIVGSGKEELLRSICGIERTTSGTVSLLDKSITNLSISDIKKRGVLFIPENRKTEGLFLNDSNSNNLIVTVLNKVNTRGYLSNSKINKMVEHSVHDLNIKMHSVSQLIRYLSGGNQQKILVSRSIADSPKLLVAMDPTRGIDVASKEDIHQILHKLAGQGLSVLVISSELDELIEMCDRIVVMNNGSITGQYRQDEFDAKEILVSMHQ